MSGHPIDIEIDLSSAAFKSAPYQIYERLRDETPVARVPMKGLIATQQNAIVLSRYGDVSAMLKDARLVKDPPNAGLPAQRVPSFMRPLTRNMLALDDPDHARLKRLVQAAFTPRRVEMMRQNTRDVSARLLDQIERKGSFDLIADYAMPLPVTVISELLGVPPQDQAKFARWSGALIRAGQSAVSAMLALPEIFAFLRYAKKLIQSKRTAPADDLVSSLVASEAEGDRLDGEELLAMVGILLSAGHETTVNLIGNGMLALIDNPDAMMQLQEQPDHVEAAVEELLRFASPIAASTHRYARQDIEISGSIIPKGSLVFGLIASANRDPRQFEGADKIDFARKPNRHLTFGEGGHYCVGAALARMEGAVAFSDILSHMPNLRLAVPRDKLRWRPGMVLTGLERCPLVR